MKAGKSLTSSKVTRLRRHWLTGVLMAALLLAPLSTLAAKVFYRYTNNEGVKVIDQQIPPEYAQQGYEVVTARGQVIKTVAPAITDAEAAAKESQRLRDEELAAWDAELRRRYSRVGDIDAAKARKLAQVDGSIAILDSNIRNLKSQIALQHSRAAESERAGRPVPGAVLKTLQALEEELKLTEEQVAQREEQYRGIEEKYEKDKQRFMIIRPNNR